MTKDARTRFTFRLPEELYETLKDKAAVKGVSVNAIILQILRDKQCRQRALTAGRRRALKHSRRKSLTDKLFEESDDLVEMLDQQRQERPEDSTECRYKILVATILPLLYARLRDCFFLLSAVLGALLMLAALGG